MVRRETAGRQETSGGIFRERDGLFRAPEQSGGSERYQVSGVNDPAEVRAERTADAVMGGGAFREADSHASGDGIFRQAEGPGPEGGPAELSSADLSEPGDTLPGDLRQSMGESMGADFSDVRVHTGPGADRASRQISARAFTRGRDVYFRSGTYDPGSREGRHLIAHELAHVAGGDGGLHRNWFTDQMDRWRNRRNAGQQQGQQGPQGQQQGQQGPQGQQQGQQGQPQGQQQGQQQQAPARTKGPNDPFDIMTDKAVDLDKQQASKVNSWAAGVETDFTTAVQDSDLEKLKKKYVAKTEEIGTGELSTDKAAMDELGQKLSAIDEYIGRLDAGLKEENVEPEIKTAYQNAKTKLETAAKESVRKDIADVGKNVLAEFNANKSAPMSDSVRAMVKDPRFKKFRELAAKLQASGADFAAGETAAAEAMGSQSAKTSLEEKQGALSLKKEGKRGDTLSKVSQGFNAVGEATGGLGESAGGVAGAATDHVEGGKIEKKNLSGEAKEKAEEEAGKLSESRAGAVQSITEGTGEMISTVGGTLDTINNSREAAVQRRQDLNAKNAMKNIAKQLERTVPAGTLRTSGDETHKRIRAVCQRIEKRKFSGKDENDSMVALIDSALEAPNVTEAQKAMLNKLKMLEMSRSSSKEAAKKMRKESVFSSLDAFGSLLRGAGGITSGVGSLIDSSVTSLVGAVLSAVGSIFGMIGAIRGALSPKNEGGEDEENQRKMEASKAAIKQMAGLPTVADADWAGLEKVAKGEADAPEIDRSKMDIAENYAVVFHSIQASNVDMADILYAVEKGEFGKDLGNNQKKTAEDSMRDMYANLSMS